MLASFGLEGTWLTWSLWSREVRFSSPGKTAISPAFFFFFQAWPSFMDSVGRKGSSWRCCTCCGGELSWVLVAVEGSVSRSGTTCEPCPPVGGLSIARMLRDLLPWLADLWWCLRGDDCDLEDEDEDDGDESSSSGGRGSPSGNSPSARERKCSCGTWGGLLVLIAASLTLMSMPLEFPASPATEIPYFFSASVISRFDLSKTHLAWGRLSSRSNISPTRRSNTDWVICPLVRDFPKISSCMLWTASRRLPSTWNICSPSSPPLALISTLRWRRYSTTLLQPWWAQTDPSLNTQPMDHMSTACVTCKGEDSVSTWDLKVSGAPKHSSIKSEKAVL